MPHADSSLVPATIKTKGEFWDHVYQQLEALIGETGNWVPCLINPLAAAGSIIGYSNWVSNLSNAAALVYHSLQSFESFGKGDGAVNWCGFYLDSALFPGQTSTPAGKVLHLGPFNGRPACQLIRCEGGKGVCADAWAQTQTVVVRDVEAYPGHIACDSETKSEIVIPMVLDRERGSIVLGVMDLDCLALGGFDETDKKGLEKIVQLLIKSCIWNV